jgi:hypothetical protein
MKLSNLLASALAIGVPLMASCGAPAEDKTDADHQNGRTAVVVPIAGREAIRKEMRQMLAALSSTLTALVNGDSGDIADVARSGGTTIAVDVEETSDGQ